MAPYPFQYPGWTARLLTHPIRGLDDYRGMIETLTTDGDAIKVFVEIADDGPLLWRTPPTRCALA